MRTPKRSRGIGTISILGASILLITRQAMTRQTLSADCRRHRPDILGLQQVARARDSGEIIAILGEVLPPGGDRSCQVQRGEDSVIVSRFSLSLGGSARTYHRSGYTMALVDLPGEAFRQVLYVVCAHFHTGGEASDIALRQKHADEIVSLLADARMAGGAITLPAGTPFVVLGDFNVYETDPAHHTTLLMGDIQDEAGYGQDAPSDWDGTSLADVLPTHNAAGGATYTWRDNTQPFIPCKLDRIL